MIGNPDFPKPMLTGLVRSDMVPIAEEFLNLMSSKCLKSVETWWRYGHFSFADFASVQFRARTRYKFRTEQSSNIFEQQLGTIIFASTTAYYPNYPNNCLHLRLIQPSFRVDTHSTSNEWK